MMRHCAKFIFVLLAVTLFLSGCTMHTIEELYRPPKRSEDYNKLQSAMDSAMAGLEYCAPLTGENRQTVQQADLDGDGEAEYLLFAKGGEENPLRVLIFCRQADDSYLLADTIRLGGASFDQVEYVQMDGSGGVEMVLGCQVSDQVLRAVCVYTFHDKQAEQLVMTNYTKFLTCDLDEDALSELMVLRPDESDAAKGVTVLYGIENGTVERSQEVDMSGPVEKLKRVITGKLHGGKNAVFVGSSVAESAIITDVYAIVDDVFTNVSLSNESGTSVQTLRNYYVYADDIDDDGIVELPDLITMRPLQSERAADRQYLIRWYALSPDGSEVDKMYTFHNYVGGWYMQLDEAWAERISVTQTGNAYAFYLWDLGATQATKMFTVYAFSGQSREEQAVSDNRFVLYKGESVTYAAYMEVASGAIRISQEDLIDSFQLIRQDWKTGET